MVNKFLQHLEDVSEKYKNQEVVRRWLALSKAIGKNALGDWGKSQSANIKTKGVRDYAFLVIRKHGSPIHFRDVAKQITVMFDKKAHVATTNNELIKDKRFVLVGRGPMTKEEIIDKVMKERYVKENTILVNLQNPKYFKRDKDGKYTPVL
jgi:hypothetical protein